MKRHLLGFVIALLAIVVGLTVSPIRFDCIGMGHGSVDDNGIGSYWIHPYQSMFFVGLNHEGENYVKPERASEVFQQRLGKSPSEEITKQVILETSENRAVLFVITKKNLQGYCLLRKDDGVLHTVCSSSLWHVLSFEKQKFK